MPPTAQDFDSAHAPSDRVAVVESRLAEMLQIENRRTLRSGDFPLPAGFWLQADELVLLIVQDDRPDELHDFALHLARFSAARDRFEVRQAHQQAENDSDEPIRPTQELLQSLAQLGEAGERIRSPRHVPQLETVAQLDKQGVSHRQIAQMWNIALDDVKVELDNPGSVIKEGHVTLGDVERKRRHLAELEEIEVLFLAGATIQAKRRIAELRKQRAQFGVQELKRFPENSVFGLPTPS